MLGFIGPRWEQHIVSELDSALNKWIDAVPDHRESTRLFPDLPSAFHTDFRDLIVRWDPNREIGCFLSQSSALYAVYYHVQIIVHRPFISSSRKPPALAFPSLAICTNAARSCIHVMDIHFKRTGRPSFINMVLILYPGIDPRVLNSYVDGGVFRGSCPVAQYLGRKTSRCHDYRSCEGNGRGTQGDEDAQVTRGQVNFYLPLFECFIDQSHTDGILPEDYGELLLPLRLLRC